MSFEQRPLTNGLPPSIQAQSQAFNKFMPPGPPKFAMISQQQPQTETVQTSSNNSGSIVAATTSLPMNQPHLLVNGSSSHSSRTASPALNQPLNTAYLPPGTATTTTTPNFYFNQSVTQQLNSSHIDNSTILQTNKITNVMSTQPSPSSSSSSSITMNSQQNIPNLTASVQSISLSNGPAHTTLNYMQQPFKNNNQSGDIIQKPQQQPMLLDKNRQQTPLLSNNTNNIPPSINATVQGQQQQRLIAQENVMSTKPLLITSQNQQQQQQQQQFANQFGPPLSSQQYSISGQQMPPPPQMSMSTNTQVSTSAAYNKRLMYPSTQQAPSQTLHQQHHQQIYQKYPSTNQYNNSGNTSSNYQYQQNQMYNGQSQQQPTQQLHQPTNQQYDSSTNNYSGKMNVVQQGFNKFWGHETMDLMQQRHVLPATRIKPSLISLGHEFYDSVNCNSDILRCTLTKVPDSNNLLQKSRLPFGILIHPFRDLNNLPVIQCSQIVRCRSCRTYINPFVTFVDSKKWRCNLCYRVSELPDEFQYDPVSKTYGDVTRRPEVKSSTIEFIAPSEYMLRPPQPAIYVFLLDVSLIAQQSGYLQTVCMSLSENLDNLPGDARTRVGFIAYNSAVHFYNIGEGFNQPREITVVDIDDTFLPFPDNLLINLKECKELIKDLLQQLPTRFANSYDSHSALGAALQVSYKLLHQYGGRVTVFQCCLPNIGPGALQARENPNDRSSKDVQHLGPATDFYKRLALECSGQQIAVDLFLLNSQYSDLATLSGISKFSGGCIHHFPLYSNTKIQQTNLFRKTLERYLVRKIGFESVMRVRCTRGLAIHTFHGNFFVRSTDLLSLPNVNPDAGFGMQISYEESLTEAKTVCFQAALLYTSSKGERRIRVHTLCLPVVSSLLDVMNGADCQAIIGLISKMAVDRSLQSSISDARDAFINASVDVFSAFRIAQNLPLEAQGQLIAPINLSLLPIYMMALLKHVAFRTGTSTRLDDRIFAMCELKSLPLDQLMRNIYPDFYRLDELFYNVNTENDDDKCNPPLMQLSAEKLDSRSVFMMDCGPIILILIGSNTPIQILQNVFGVSSANEITDHCYELPSTGNAESEALHTFIDSISVDKPFTATIQLIRDNSPLRSLFTEKLIEDKNENSLSYYEFLQHLRTLIK